MKIDLFLNWITRFPLKEFGLELLPHGFNKFLLIGLDVIALCMPIVIYMLDYTILSVILYHLYVICDNHSCTIPFYMLLALTRKICGILSKKLQRLALFKY